MPRTFDPRCAYRAEQAQVIPSWAEIRVQEKEAREYVRTAWLFEAENTFTKVQPLVWKGELTL